MDVCDCHCNDKIITDKWCSKHESQEEIKRAGDVVKDSEQCDIVPNTQKGVFRLWCRLRKIINKNAGHWNKELETTKRNQSKLDNSIAQIKNQQKAMNSRLNNEEE